MIRVDAMWLCTEAMDMRAGTDTALARVVQVFGAAWPHHAYVFANSRTMWLLCCAAPSQTMSSRRLSCERSALRNSTICALLTAPSYSRNR